MRKLIGHLSNMPGIGPKTAERLAFYVLNSSKEEVKELATSIWEVKQKNNFCKVCNNLSESEICDICSNPRRDNSIICITEEPKDVIALEKAGNYKGLYHVLLGVLSPLDGIGPENLKIRSLMLRLHSEKIKEIMIATNADTEGETTALYLSKLIKPLGIKITRIAYGIPMGSDIDYVSQATLVKAIEGRRDF